MQKRAKMKMRLLIGLFVLAAGSLPMFARAGQELHPPTPHRHPEAQKLVNPIPSDASSIEEGRKLFQRYCASCHGATAKGDGSMALAGGTPSNLTDETWDHGSSDGEIFVVIRDGTSSDMESYKERLNDKQMWQLVLFIRGLGPKPQK